MKSWRVLYYFGILALLLLLSLFGVSPNLAHCSSTDSADSSDSNIWYVHDIIDPSSSQVQWSEEGSIDEPPSWIADERWYQASMTQSLVGPNDIFVSTYEQFNWSLVGPTANNIYQTTFQSFNDFENYVKTNPSPWLKWSWDIDPDWYGVSMNTTKVFFSYESSNSSCDLWAWFHITRIPEYIVGQGNLENWLTGFDLTPVSTGSLSLWELYKDYGSTGIYYNLRFKAPADILIQHGSNFTCTIPISPSYQEGAFQIQQLVDINMPANTEVKQTLPFNLSTRSSNTASFLVKVGDYYPESFTVVSGSPTPSFAQTLENDIAIWLLAPGGWAAIASLIVLTYTGFRGRRILSRNKLYHRIYKSMVTIFDLYSKEPSKFYSEMENISKSSIKMLLEDKITDEQFEKLLKRRDDLINRSEEQLKTPPS